MLGCMCCGAVAPAAADEPVPSTTEVGIAEPPLRRVKTHEKPQKRLLSMYHRQLLLAHLTDNDHTAYYNSSYSQSTREEPKARVSPVLTERFTVTSKPTEADHDYVCTCICWLSRTANSWRCTYCGSVSADSVHVVCRTERFSVA